MAIAPYSQYDLAVWRRRATTGQRNCYYFEIIINIQSFLAPLPLLRNPLQGGAAVRALGLHRRRSVYEECKQRVTKRWAINRPAHIPYIFYYVFLFLDNFKLEF